MKTSVIKKVAGFDKVRLICDSFGASYNPSNAALQPTALVALLELAQEKVQAVNVSLAAYTMAINASADSFEGIPKLAVRVARLASAAGVSKSDLEEVKMIKRRMFQQKRKLRSGAQGAENAEAGIPRTRSTSMRDRDSIMNTLQHLIELVQRIPGYGSYDPEFTVDGLKARLAELQAVNLAALQAKVNLSNARIARDKVLDGPGGVVEVMAQAKNYIRAKFGYFSDEAHLTRPTVLNGF